MTTERPPLDRWRADEALAAGKPEKLWGLPQIAEALGVSETTARRWAADPMVPIYHPLGSGSYFAFRSELLQWLRGQAA